jgi:hypothetical protein
MCPGAMPPPDPRSNRHRVGFRVRGRAGGVQVRAHPGRHGGSGSVTWTCRQHLNTGCRSAGDAGPRRRPSGPIEPDPLRPAPAVREMCSHLAAWRRKQFILTTDRGLHTGQGGQWSTSAVPSHSRAVKRLPNFAEDRVPRRPSRDHRHRLGNSTVDNVHNGLRHSSGVRQFTVCCLLRIGQDQGASDRCDCLF